MKEVVIVSAVRIAGGKASAKGILRDTRPEYMGKLCMQESIKRAGIKPEIIDDVIWGCSTPEQSMGMNIARITSLYAGVPESVPAVTINRFCSSGLQAISFGAEAIISGRCDVVMAGGVEHMGMVPMGGVVRPNPEILKDKELKKVYTSMGMTAENVANRYGVTREEQDEFALESHKKAERATLAGKFKEEIVPIQVTINSLNEKNELVGNKAVFDVDEGIRYGLEMDSLKKLKPVFAAAGSVTAGNSSQMTNGSAALIMMSMDKAKELGIKPRLLYKGFAAAGCGADEMGVGPVYAIPKVLKQTGLELKDIGLIELNEAFASQSLYCIKKLGIDPAIVNVNGGAIALGHPLGATGAKLTVTLMHEMERQKTRYGMVTMCIGGGQGAAGIFELI